jgi:hypothetical protein
MKKIRSYNKHQSCSSGLQSAILSEGDSSYDLLSPPSSNLTGKDFTFLFLQLSQQPVHISVLFFINASITGFFCNNISIDS